jgi:hypothetical protein
MSVSKRTLLAAGIGSAIGLSTVAIAQTPTAKGNKKSAEVSNLDEGEAHMIDPKGHRLHKSHVKVTAAHHEAALKKGAREVRAGAVMYRQAGKLYMLEDSGNEKASQHFQDHFDIDY